MNVNENPRPPLPRFDAEAATQKVHMVEDAWNTGSSKNFGRFMVIE